MKRRIWDLIKRAFRRCYLEDVDRALLPAFERRRINSRQLHDLDAALKGYKVACAVALAAGLAACTLPGGGDETTIVNTATNNNGPTAVPTGPPTPLPSPGVPGASDVASMIVLVYGYTCQPGTPDPNHAAGVIPPECSAAQLTATPKRADGSDATNHGINITWSVVPAPDGNFPGQVVPQDNNPLFNREVNALNGGVRVPGSVTLTAKLIAPDGREFQASKVVTVAP